MYLLFMIYIYDCDKKPMKINFNSEYYLLLRKVLLMHGIDSNKYYQQTILNECY